MARVLEILWLVIGLIGMVAVAYSLINKDFQQSVYFIVLTGVSGVMYTIRKNQRKRLESEND